MNTANSTMASDVQANGLSFYAVLIGAFLVVACAVGYIYWRSVSPSESEPVPWTALVSAQPIAAGTANLDVRIAPELSSAQAFSIGTSDEFSDASGRLIGQVRVSRVRTHPDGLHVGIEYLRTSSTAVIEIELDRSARSATVRYAINDNGWKWMLVHGAGQIAISSWELDQPLVLELDLEGHVAKSDRVDAIRLKKHVKLSLKA